jgi:archaellum component FlaG (FlaF/FlaG flagellin family)
MKSGKKALLVVVTVFMMLAAIAPGAFAATTEKSDRVCDEFYLMAAHGINGKRLGLEESALPVDVYVNGGYAFTFSFKDVVKDKLPAGNYTITVNLAGTQTEVMRLGPVDIPGCVKVRVVAKLVDGVPTLLPKITPLPNMK